MSIRYTLIIALVAVLGFAACGDTTAPMQDTGGLGVRIGGRPGAQVIQSNSANKKITITIGSKNFTEEFILADIYAQALRAKGYTVKTRLNIGNEHATFRALKHKRINAYPEYTGTALNSIFGIKAHDIPVDSVKAYGQAKAAFAQQGVAALFPTPFSDSNAVAVTPATAQRFSLHNISDLKAKAGMLTLAGPPECRQREDCLLGLQQVYGLKFKRFIPINPALRHDVLRQHRADVSIVFTTDGQIKIEKEILLPDNRHIFPPYNVSFLVNNHLLHKAGPDLVNTVALIQQGLTIPVMQELNSRADLDRQKPAAVAAQYLVESGYIRPPSE